jgi:hypothetical protein
MYTPPPPSIKVIIRDKSRRTLDVHPNLLESVFQLGQVVLSGMRQLQQSALNRMEGTRSL